MPIIDVSSLPLCNGTNGTPNIDCKPANTGTSFAQKEGEEEGFKYPGSNGFDLPELPECTGMNGPDAGGRKIQCRQIGRFTTTGNWFAQIQGEDDKEDKGPNYAKLTAGTP